MSANDMSEGFTYLIWIT